MCGEDRTVQQFDLRGKGIFLPGGQIDQYMRVSGKQVGCAYGEFFHQLEIAVGPADAVQAPQSGQDGLHIRGAEQRAVDLVPFHDGYAAVFPRFCHQWDPGHAEGFDIPIYRTAGYLEFLRQIRRRHFLLLQQDR